jgi:pyruvate/2-oxoglutarate dehydrogenase complex dihydrolipoamide acyltransferase (E2) component
MTNTVVKMPQLGESVSEGTIGRWLKQPGDRVERDEPLVEIQTDKVNAEIPSPVAGILQQILLPEGTTAAVKSDMAIIGDETVVAAEPEPMPATSPTASLPAAAPAPPSFTYDKAAAGGVVGQRDDDPPPAPAANGVKRFYTPVVLRMAEEHALDLSKIQGSGAHGRVTRRDVERAIAEPAVLPSSSGRGAGGEGGVVVGVAPSPRPLPEGEGVFSLVRTSDRG